MTVATVTLYKHNRLDQAEQRSPEQLAADFVATLKGKKYSDYRRSGRRSIEFEFRWWLADPAVECWSWDEEDWPALLDALCELIDSDEGARQTILDVVSP
jgi:hypothetical protein